MAKISDDAIVTGPELAKLLGITPTTVSKLGGDGTVVRCGRGRYRLGPSVRGYCESHRKASSHRTSPTQTERARVLRLQGDRLEQQMKVERKDLVSFAEGVATAATMSHLFRSSLLAARTRLAGQLSLSRADSEIVYEWACSVLTEISQANSYADDLQAVAQEAVEKELAKERT
jgi:phage terminase Nu1 subunit (DNA packaging protein)